MITDGVWKPTKVQEEFLKLPFSIFEALFGGAAGGGKSELLLFIPIIYNFFQNPRFHGCVFRRTFPQLEASLIPRSAEIYRPFGGDYNTQNHLWTFPSGARIRLSHMARIEDARQHDTNEYQYLGFDELTAFAEFQYLFLLSRVRSTDVKLPAIVRSATNPGNEGHCLNKGDVLTPHGWVDIKTIKVGDSIYEVSPDGILELSTVAQKHGHNYAGKLWKCTSSNLQITCTPEHRIARKNTTKTNDSFSLNAAKDLPSQVMIRRTAKLNTCNTLEIKLFGKSVDIVDYASLMGWFISEGFVNIKKGNIGIAQTKEQYKLEIARVLTACGLSYVYQSNSFISYGKELVSYFEQFGKCRDKFIPRNILNEFPLEALETLFQVLMNGDGHWVRQGKSGIYYTISKQLADDVAELAVKIGKKVFVKSRQRNNRDGLSYEVFISNEDYTEILTGQSIYKVRENNSKRKLNVSYEDFDGSVYDIGTPLYHTFVVRQNGYVWVSGNSWVKKRFVTPSPFGRKIIYDRITQTKKIFIPAKLTDNLHLMKADPSYINRLRNLPLAEQKAKIDGDWDAFAGQAFDEFRDIKYPDEPDNAMHVISPFEVPLWWPRIIGIDWGYNAYTWAGWFAVAPNKRVFLYREYFQRQKKIVEWSSEIARLSHGENIVHVSLDPSAWQDRGDPHNIAL